MIETSLFFDIETLPTDRADLIADIDAGVTHPGTMSKAETIAAWVAEKRPAVVSEAVGKTALDGGTGRIASIAWAIGDGPIRAYDARPLPGLDAVAAERSVITTFLADARDLHDRFRCEPTLVGHNISGFDVRWLWKRAIVLGIAVPHWWPIDARPWERERVYDTMLVWEGHGGRISQDRLARILGLDGKGDFNGSMVAAAWAAGEYEKVRSYNRDDVRTVRRIWRRMEGHRPAALAVAA